MAEAVETAEQVAILRGIGAGAAQGYYFSPPALRRRRLCSRIHESPATLLACQILTGEETSVKTHQVVSSTSVQSNPFAMTSPPATEQVRPRSHERQRRAVLRLSIGTSFETMQLPWTYPPWVSAVTVAAELTDDISVAFGHASESADRRRNKASSISVSFGFLTSSTAAAPTRSHASEKS